MIGQLLTGRYLILKKLGSGGFSETYLARDKYLPLHPLCVVKCLRLSSDSTISLETAQHLFETEAGVLDRLGRSHPQIPTLFAYCHEQDQVYQIQEYIEGENLGNWISQGRRISSEAAIDLLQQVLPILDFIHSHRVIHRDIKPSNLIRRHQDGKIVLIDFGAACLQSETHASTEFGEPEQPFAIGTPGYMPGEQEAGTSSFNSDLYALGMSVLHLLTGVHPHQFQLDPISGELDWQTHLGSQTIDSKLVEILNCMVRMRDRDRYQQASEVLSVLRSHPAAKARSFPHWSSSVKPRSKWRRLQPLALALLLVGGGGWHLYRQGEPAQAVIAHVHQLFQPSPQAQLTLVHDLEIKSTIQQMVISPDNRLLVTAGADHALRLWSLPEGSVFQSLLGHTDTVTALSISADGQFLVSGSDDRTVRLWDVASGTLLHTFTGHQQGITTVAIHPNAGIVVSGDRNGTIRLWDLQTGDVRQTLHVPEASITAVTYAESSRLISASSDRQIQVWDLKTGKLQRTFAGHMAAIVSLRVMNDQTLYSVGEDRTLVWDIDREELVQVFSKDSANPMTALLDDRHLMTVHDNGNIRVWARQAGHLLATISGQVEQYLHATLSSDHRYLVGFSADQRLQVWRMNASPVQ